MGDRVVEDPSGPENSDDVRSGLVGDKLLARTRFELRVLVMMMKLKALGKVRRKHLRH